jgi:hypothetical protein
MTIFLQKNSRRSLLKQEEIKKDIKEGLALILCRKGEKWQHSEICSIFSGFQVMRNFAV